MKTKLTDILARMREKHPALASVTEDAFDSLASGEGNPLSEEYEPIAQARKIAISYGIDLDPSEQDPDVLNTALADLVVVMSNALSAVRTGTTFTPEEDPDYDTEDDDQHYEDELLKIKKLRSSLTSFSDAETRCDAQSGFWEKIPNRFHSLYATMLIDLCQDFVEDPLDFWVTKSRG